LGTWGLTAFSGKNSEEARSIACLQALNSKEARATVKPMISYQLAQVPSPQASFRFSLLSLVAAFYYCAGLQFQLRSRPVSFPTPNAFNISLL